MGRRPAVSAGGCGYELRDWLRLAVVAALLLRVVSFFMAWLRAWGDGVFDAHAGFFFFVFLYWRRRGVAVAGRETALPR